MSMFADGGNNYGGGGSRFNNSVNTSFLISAGKTFRVTVSGWNRSMTVDFTRAIGADQYGKIQYDQDLSHKINLSLKGEYVYALQQAMKDILLPAVEKGEDAMISIQTDAIDRSNNESYAKILTIGAQHNEAGEYETYIAIIPRATLDGTATADEVKHILGTNEYIKDYNMDGSGEKIVVQTDFNRLVDIVMHYNMTIPMINHGLTYAKATRSSFVRNTGNGGGYGMQQNFNGGGFNNAGGFNQNMGGAPSYNVGGGYTGSAANTFMPNGNVDIPELPFS